jgi:hypothetical protein
MYQGSDECEWWRRARRRMWHWRKRLRRAFSKVGAIATLCKKHSRLLTLQNLCQTLLWKQEVLKKEQAEILKTSA